MALHWKLLIITLSLLPFADFGLSCDLRGYRQRAAVMQTAAAVEGFRHHCGRLPHSLDELAGPIVVAPACQGRSFVKASSLHDWYGKVNYYRTNSGAGFVVRSFGRDRVFGSADDYASDIGTPGSWQWSGWDPDPRWLRTVRGLLGLLVVPSLLVIAALSLSRAVVCALVRLGRRIVRRS
jgi:hypothetical protein